MTKHNFNPDYVRYILACIRDGDPVEPPGLYHETMTGDDDLIDDDGTSPWSPADLLLVAACCFYRLPAAGGGGEEILGRLVSAALEVAAVEGADQGVAAAPAPATRRAAERQLVFAWARDDTGPDAGAGEGPAAAAAPGRPARGS